ncbi:MAG: HAD hydrolase-like protein [Candidatus Lokiarchaeota archaeon]|nr:HAD hydrolase-like protein [Candidatus Lokiarchaeota archaeon]
MIEAIFFDDGGVLNDNTLRTPQWRKLIADYFIPRYGGSVESWAEANKQAAEEILKRMEEVYESGSSTIPPDYHEIDDREWLAVMFDYHELEPPEDTSAEARAAIEWITARVKASYPGIIQVINELAPEYTLYTASNEPRYRLEHYLRGMGILEHFEELFGSDILHAFKNTTYYFEKIVEITDVDPETSIFIDDRFDNLLKARNVGFHVIHSGLAGDEKGEFPYFRETLELPQLIRSLEANDSRSRYREN